MQHDDLLFEIVTEELPPKTLASLAIQLAEAMQRKLSEASLHYGEVNSFATPRRIAVLIKKLESVQPAQVNERKGPTWNAAFDGDGNPTKACLGFARSCGVDPKDLMKLSSEQGEWVGFQQNVPGKRVQELLPSIVEQSINVLHIAKRMRWGDHEIEFIRPVHSVILLYGDEIITTTVLGCQSGRTTVGHRFHAPFAITIPHAGLYASLLESEGHVLADFKERRNKILNLADACLKEALKNPAATLRIEDSLLNEVTGLVEWPVAYLGQFEEKYLQLPDEVLISAMQNHQRYFPVIDKDKKLLPYFLTISNIQSKDAQRLIHGNERVLRARLADAAFFYQSDKKESLFERKKYLAGMIFQAQLGTINEKTERMAALAMVIAGKLKADSRLAERAALLAKSDLTTQMVGEFPELQGVMSSYYARHDGEHDAVVMALREQYYPRFADDVLPKTLYGQVLALADRIDTLVGYFSVGLIPTGDKDPYGLRRAVIGIIRILVEEHVSLDLKEMIQKNVGLYPKVKNADQVVADVLLFIQERMRAWYQDTGIQADVFAAVAAIGISNPLDVDKRIKAVQAFKRLTAAESLSVANKRVRNILSKNLDLIESTSINPKLFEHVAEKNLAERLEEKNLVVKKLYAEGDYETVLIQLSELRAPIDDFFDHVMVMAEDKNLRENRILLLNKLRALFVQVADIALLQ